MSNTVMIVVIAVLAVALCAVLVACFLLTKSAEQKGFENGAAKNRQETEKTVSDAKAAAEAKSREAQSRIEEADKKIAAAESLIENAEKAAEAKKKEALVEAK
ncbi:MAG: hypothetical protein K2I93_09290, partial [Oscillospiraceae bacterium]|nr:hypothetical protein [Oscillospiraceae bacterium]